MIGNVKLQSFREMWEGPKLKELRNRFYDVATLPEICKKCEVYAPANV